MGRTLTELATQTLTEIGESTANTQNVTKIKSFLNVGYKELSRIDKIEKSEEVNATDYLFAKPADFYKVANIVYGDMYLTEYEEEGTNIRVPYNGAMTLHYYCVPETLTDNNEPKTNPMNDEYIKSFAKYKFYQSDDNDQKAEIHKRDYETLKIVTPSKTYKMIVER